MFACLVMAKVLLVGALRSSSDSSLTADLVREDKLLCTPPLPHFQMRMCVRLFTPSAAADAAPLTVESPPPEGFTWAEESGKTEHSGTHDASHGHGASPAQVVVNGIPLILGAEKIVKQQGGHPLDDHKLIRGIPDVEMEQGWLGCPECQDGMKECGEDDTCLSDPKTGEAFPWQVLNSQNLRALLTAQCVDIGHLLAHKGLHDTLHFVPFAHQMVDNKLKEQVANWVAGQIMHKLLHGSYCMYFAEHRAGETLTGENKQVITFPQDSVCIDQLWHIETPKVLNVKLEMPPSPLVCWPTAKGVFSQPVVPWTSPDFAK